ncbi:tyrosine-type recombinase/integrase [Halanaerobacter jeridensis]|uniref:Integrase n=1 Tax=Halanaerobacter jeridensis TaxID=706427 RepID=A0A938XSD8_9FIRM|nr:site-specific integrase [Halanaerobacter jeridensis]MBM7556831.1 integrase [Halanaerobacter jeridensis]
MANITKKGRQKYQICIECGRNPQTGKRKRKYETFNGTKTEAKKRAAELEHEIKSNQFIEDTEETVGSYLKEWLRNYKHNLAPSTYESYDIIINSHLIPALGQKKLSELGPQDIERYQAQKLSSGRKDGKQGGLSTRTVQYHHRVLSKALKKAEKYNLIRENPAKLVQAPTPNTPEINPLSKDEVNKLLDQAEGFAHDLIYLGVKTGMRRGELLALRWSDIDFENKKITVRQSMTKVTGEELSFNKPKTKSSQRPIQIDDEIITMLKKRKAKQEEYKEKFGNKYDNQHKLVFRKNNGKPFLPQYATKMFNQVAEAAELGEFRLHDLRHTHATLMLKSEVHPKIVQERLGHSSITQTLDTYSHVIPSMQKEAVDKFNANFDFGLN